MTFIVDAAVHCGAESACNDWRLQYARTLAWKSDLILQKLSPNSRTNARVQGRSKHEAERDAGRVRRLGQQLRKWMYPSSRRMDYMKYEDITEAQSEMRHGIQ